MDRITKYRLGELGPFYACYCDDVWLETLTSKDVFSPMEGVIVARGSFHYQMGDSDSHSAQPATPIVGAGSALRGPERVL